MRRMNFNTDFSADEYKMFEEKCNFNKFNGEVEVYKLLRDGASIVEIARITGLSDRTVSRRIASIKFKILRIIK